MGARCKLGIELGRGFEKGSQGFWDTAVFLARLFDDARKKEVLELLVRAQPQHLLASPRKILGTQIRVDEVKQRLEFP